MENSRLYYWPDLFSLFLLILSFVFCHVIFLFVFYNIFDAWPTLTHECPRDWKTVYLSESFICHKMSHRKRLISIFKYLFLSIFFRASSLFHETLMMTKDKIHKKGELKWKIWNMKFLVFFFLEYNFWEGKTRNLIEKISCFH